MFPAQEVGTLCPQFVETASSSSNLLIVGLRRCNMSALNGKRNPPALLITFNERVWPDGAHQELGAEQW